MSKGVLIFAYNNETVDYLSMARWSARNINRHLGIPTAIVTNETFEPLEFEQCIQVESPTTTQKRYFRDHKAAGIWYNTNRVSAYELSPWEHTLLLDSDYVVASDQLKVLFDIDQDFLAHRWAYDITGNLPFDGNRSFGTYQMPMMWATVVAFRRSKKAQLIFDSMEMIRNNWNHYLQLYQIDEQTYRNDYALSIAMNIVNGHTLSDPVIPWRLTTVTPETKLTQVVQDTYKIQYTTVDQKQRWMTVRQDFHAMCKRDLGEIVGNSS
jgi:hypothetical protein